MIARTMLPKRGFLLDEIYRNEFEELLISFMAKDQLQ